MLKAICSWPFYSMTGILEVLGLLIQPHLGCLQLSCKKL